MECELIKIEFLFDSFRVEIEKEGSRYHAYINEKEESGKRIAEIISYTSLENILSCLENGLGIETHICSYLLLGE